MLMKRQTLLRLYALIVLLLTAQDAFAWGLYTHVFYAQHLPWLMPLFDKRLIVAAKRFPHLVMAGACIPDLAIISQRFSVSHSWDTAQHFIRNSKTDEERAMALGFASHLLIDVLAHQHFVPMFEAKWKHNSMVTHVVCEWAMDAHLKTKQIDMPHQLLYQYQTDIIPFVSRCLNVCEAHTRKSVFRLAHADFLLRRFKIPNLLYWWCAKRDNEFVSKLEFYKAETMSILQHFPNIVAGRIPRMHAECNPLPPLELEVWREKCLQEIRLRKINLMQLYEHYHTQMHPSQHLS